MSNIQTVQSIYAAFGKGDTPTILSHLTKTIEWEYGMSDAGVPWLQPRRGTGGAGAPRTLDERATERAFHQREPYFVEALRVE